MAEIIVQDDLSLEDKMEAAEVEAKVPASNKRLQSLDVLRGLTVVLMITANYQSDDPFPQIEHAEWFGFSIADAVFPTFVFVMGLAIPLALGAQV
ncbi:hypothetical protein L0F63_005364 [Massospora cicadina]|nr:hypothetical protein L0F63_005364 [Massospora cicadina]